MNDIFEMRRFGKFLSTELAGVARRHGITLLLASMMPLFLFLLYRLAIATMGIEGWRLRIEFETGAVAFVTSIAFFIAFPILCYGDITDRKKGSGFIMLPVSRTEKFIGIALITLVIAPAIFITLYLGTDYLIMKAFPDSFDCGMFSSLAEGMLHNSIFFSYDEHNNYMNLNLTMNTFMPLTVCTAGLAGGFVFKRHKGAYTFLTCTLLLVTFTGIFIKIIDITPRSDWNTVSGIIWHSAQFIAIICFLAISYHKTKTIEL